MLRAAAEILRSDGTLPTLSDTRLYPGGRLPGQEVLEIALKRYPEEVGETVRAIFRQVQSKPTGYAVWHLDAEDFESDALFAPPEAWFPDWMTAFARHGSGENATLLTLAANPPGGHRHEDNLALYYVDSGDRVLGDHGYLSASPAQQWIHSTQSHNLVIVDGQDQLHRGDRRRTPRFEMMLATPELTAVEASSNCYPGVDEYRRLIVLLKGPGARTMALDVFRVAGGSEHDWRLFSELASSTAVDGERTFHGLDMPPDAPVPDFGASTEMEHVFGLRDVHSADNPPPAWQCVWREKDRAYRLWMVSPVDEVAASNGPGQETWQDDVGRRVRYIDAIRRGSELKSTFVALHEPSDKGGAFPVRKAERVSVPAEAGPDAVAVRIDSEWGEYLILSEFVNKTLAAGVIFAGKLGVFCRNDSGERWMVASSASTFLADNTGFAGECAEWAGVVLSHDEWSIVSETEPPRGWALPDDGVVSYALVELGDRTTGFPMSGIQDRLLRFERFPLLRGAKAFAAPCVRRIRA